MAFAAIFSIAATEGFQTKSFYEIYKWYICVAFLSAGPIAWLTGRSLNARFANKRILLTEPQPQGGDTEEQEAGEKTGTFMLFDLAYWGPMLIAFGGIICFIPPVPGGRVQVVHARTTSTSPPPKPNTPTNAPPQMVEVPMVANQPVAFPPLKLQGLTYGLLNRSALIDGRTYFVGDYVREAKIVSIKRQRVVVEFQGQTKVLVLGN